MSAKCACGSTRFHATYQAWVTGTVDIDDNGVHVDGPVVVEGGEMHAEWLTFLSCAECGLTYRPHEGGFTDADANDVERQPGLVAACDRLIGVVGDAMQWSSAAPLEWEQSHDR